MNQANGGDPISNIQRYLTELAVGIGERPVGTPANRAAHDYLFRTLQTLGLDPVVWQTDTLQSVAKAWRCSDVTGEVSILPGASTLSLDAVDTPVHPVIYRSAEEMQAEPPPRGSIAVVALGQTHESKFCSLANGAVAVAWFRESHRGLYSGNCKQPQAVPVVAGFAIDESTALRWTSTPTVVTAEISTDEALIALRSIVCDITPTDDPVPCFVSHFDSKPAVQGANDNASGVAVLLSMLERWPADRPARFIFFDGEEIGVRGSTAYVEHLEQSGHLGEIAYVICPDSVGLGELYLYTGDKFGPFPQSSMDVARAAFRSQGWDVPERAARSGGSDYQPFHRRGIPSVFLSDFPNHVRHTTEDTIDRVDLEVLERLTDVMLTLGLGPLPSGDPAQAFS